MYAYLYCLPMGLRAGPKRPVVRSGRGYSFGMPGAKAALFDDVETLKAAISINVAAGRRHAFERIAADAAAN